MKVNVRSNVLQFGVTVLLAIAANESSNAQGGWDIEYISLEKVDSTMLGKEMRIDFKRSIHDTLEFIDPQHGEVLWLLHKEDTVKIMINDEPMLFVEQWEWHTDMGYVGDQYLKSIMPVGWMVNKMTLLRIEEDSLFVEASALYEKEKCKSIIIAIQKAVVKGVLFIMD